MKRQLIVMTALAVLAACGTAFGEAVYRDGKWVDVPEPTPGTPEGDAALIAREVKAGNNSEALDRAEAFIEAHPNHARTEDAMALAGQAELNRGRYWQAHNWYDRQLSNFPTGRLFERGLYREAEIADAFLAGKKRVVWRIFRLGATDEGLEIHRRVAERLPGSRLAEQSIMKIADYHARKGHWPEAAAAYQDYVELFGRRYRSEQAEHLAAHAVYSSFAGVDYDDTPLLEAEQRYTSLAARYPQGEAAKVVPSVLGEIERAKAEKDYRTACFYARTGRPKPAAFYHREVIELYGSTEWARRSAEALAKMGQPVAPARPATRPGTGDAGTEGAKP